jgi:PPOX class probable F420-dependent enzyme
VSHVGTHADLLDRALPAVLTTEMPDGRLQSTVVWYQREGGHLYINTMREFQKARNLHARPRATLLVMEPGEAGRWIEVRADAVVDRRDALAHLDELALWYTGHRPYFGAVVPAELAGAEHPVVFRLDPVAVVTGPRSFPGGRCTDRPAGSPPDPPSCVDEPTIPPTHRSLLGAPNLAALSTRLPSGRAQTQPVWCLLDGNDVLVATTRQRRKARNLAADPRATVLVMDGADSGRWIEVRGDVTVDERGALAVLDRLTRQYTGQAHYYGSVYPAEQQRHENRVTARIHPRRITCDAVHH